MIRDATPEQALVLAASAVGPRGAGDVSVEPDVRAEDLPGAPGMTTLAMVGFFG
ncbi:hypothetical protein [Couchioplanes caeruleus]|uniref:hypothetical protein n=1 Tax=Couchioplanes caeruleus TaxID=56438 RepID=UPI0014732D48|nr:hypothetical protein [Couchioplanes caeruleus]